MRYEDKPAFRTCQVTVKHFSCKYLAPVGHKYNKETDMRELFENTKTVDIMSDLKEIGL